MTEAVAIELRHWLFEPEISREQRQVPVLDSRQRELASTRTPTGYRRIKGPAGSGKSTVLAARAAALLYAGQRVLVVTYNITLRQYLRNTAALFGIPKFANAEWLHFHDWCKRVCVLSGHKEEHDGLWASGNCNEILETGLARLVGKILSANPDAIDRYDAILVDEAQDLRPLWWSTLRLALKPKGEAVLVADLTQDIYGIGKAWTDGVMRDAGFAGAWTQLKGSYRLPTAMLPLAQEFAKRFLPQSTRDLPDRPELDLPLDICLTKWVQVLDKSLIWPAIKLQLDVLMSKPDWHDSIVADIAIVTQTKAVGEKIVSRLQALGIRVQHTFAENPQAEKKRKLVFSQGYPGVKVTTVHSYKGWECSCLIVVVTEAGDMKHLSEVYTALTRVKRTAVGSAIAVVCSDSNLKDYGTTWPQHDSTG